LNFLDKLANSVKRHSSLANNPVTQKLPRITQIQQWGSDTAMPVELSEKTIRQIVVAKGERVDLVDSRCRGLMLRVSSTKRSWSFVYRDRTAGKTERIHLGSYPETGLARARDLADAARRQTREGGSPRRSLQAEQQASRTAITFGELCDQFIEIYAKPRKRSWMGDQFNLAQAAAAIGADRPAREVTRGDLVRFLEAKASTTPTQANRVHASLNTALNWAAQRETLPANPLAGVKKQSAERPKERALSDVELAPFLRGLVGPDAPARQTTRGLMFILATACRPAEAAGLTFDEIDMSAATWTLPAARSKNKRSHQVPLSGLALDLIGVGEAGPVFVSPARPGLSIRRDSLANASARLANKLAIAPFTPHDLRRTAATILERKGVPFSVIGALLNHSKAGVTAVYARHDFAAEKRSAVETLATHLRNLIEG
jgi:integrase